MPDIVERLDSLVATHPGHPVGKIAGDAKAEIEHMRGTLAAYRRDHDRLQAEVERLREANQKWLEYSQREIEPELKDEVANLTVECKRLRTAIRQILALYQDTPTPFYDDRIEQIANEALGADCVGTAELHRKATWVWYGYPGHLIVSRDCAFHMSTRIGEYFVSTVGDYRPDPDGEMQTIGAGSEDYFETMVFPCAGEDEHGNPDIDFSEIVCVRYATSREADAGHRAMCARVASGKVHIAREALDD